MTWDELRAEWPHLYFWEGVAGLLYVKRPRSSPPLIKRALEVEDLRDQIRAEVRYRADHWG